MASTGTGQSERVSPKPDGKLFQDIYDPRYPRSRLFKIFREPVRFWWLLVVYYVSNIGPDMLKLLADQGFEGIANGPSVAHALALDQVAQLLRSDPQHYTWVLIVLFVILACMTYAGVMANRDHERESRALHAREQIRLFSAIRDGQVPLP